MDSDKDSDEIQTSLFIEIEESEKNQGTLEVLDEVLGEGEYGIVYKGRYGGRNGSITDVAVKKLKGNACTLAKAALLNEIRTLKQAGRHPNIFNLIGTWVQGETILVVTELVHGGSFESFLRCKGDGGNEYANVHCKLNDRQLLKIALQGGLGNETFRGAEVHSPRPCREKCFYRSKHGGKSRRLWISKGNHRGWIIHQDLMRGRLAYYFGKWQLMVTHHTLTFQRHLPW